MARTAQALLDKGGITAALTAEFLVTGDKRDMLSLALPGIIGVSEFERRLSALRFG